MSLIKHGIYTNIYDEYSQITEHKCVYIYMHDCVCAVVCMHVSILCMYYDIYKAIIAKYKSESTEIYCVSYLFLC